MFLIGVLIASLTVSAGVAAGGPKARSWPGKIAFSRNNDLFVVSADGSGLHQLTNTPDLEDSPSWSPDGMSIAYRHFNDQTGPGGEIDRISSSGGPATVLEREPSTVHGLLSEPIFSPNGRLVACNSGRPNGPVDTIRIWTVDLAGAVRPVTSDFGATATWSPNSAQLAYVGLSSPDSHIGTIFVTGLSGAAPRNVTHATVNDQSPAWSPNGKWIAFVRLNPGWQTKQTDTIELIHPDGSGLHAILRGGILFTVAWSPASDAVLVLRVPKPPDPRRQLLIVPLKGGPAHPLPGTTGAAGHASWHR